MLAPAAGRPWRGAWPLVARTDDGNAWVTGVCWLYCRREGVRVLRVGSVNAPGATGDLYACGPCLAELDRLVRAQAYGRAEGRTRVGHAAAFAVPAYAAPACAAGAAGCEHQRTEFRHGKTFCRVCAWQLYL
ncbi:hypothetical protein ACFCV8_33115 [Streptomyces sp. NPDC056347]|uniref:hypothetical protein n=1 Tax=Streptomyces sp. NPDC056347 TaxID=3345790 RepID=UPI0035D6E620